MLLQPVAAVNTVEEQRARWERKRSRTAKELVETEQKYLEQLDLVTTYFLTILKAKGTLQPAVREGIFGLLESIHCTSQYKHLFRDLMENTSPDSVEFQYLAKAVKSVSEVSQWVHSTIRSHENSMQLLRVQKLLKGQKTKVLTPGRWYIQEGWLMVVPTKGEEVKRKMFFLFSDILVATKPCHPLHPLNSDKFSCQAVYPLSQCTVDKVFGHTQSQGGLLSLSFPHKTLLLMSSNQEDINNWYLNLTTAIRQLKARPTFVHQKEYLTEQPVSSRDTHTVQEMCQDL